MPKGINSKGMKANGRGAGGPTFLMAFNAIFQHPDYLALSKTARAFLWDFAHLYNGFNNGNLSAAPTIMGRMGWDKNTASRCRRELEERGWIAVTRYPKAKREPILYRITWQELDRWEGRPHLDPEAYKVARRSLRVPR